jgi:L-cysteine S-thiosulfotransferase
MNQRFHVHVLLALAGGLAACANTGSNRGATPAQFQAMLKDGFQANGPVGLDRLVQDDTQSFCSDPARATRADQQPVRAKIEAANLATVKVPADGQYLGDWKEGEKIAQSGRGLTWTDDPKQPNGGNCYNCHQIDKKEISFGTIGPSLWNYGKLRGVADPEAPASAEMIRYTWSKIYNAKAFNACSNMPRAGFKGILTEQQIKHVMALLLDPKSPVNQ